MTDPVVAAVAGRPTRRALALVFLQIGLMGFGGVLPAARKVLVDDRRWLTDQEFTELLSIGQALPGPNVVNVTTAYAARQHGAVGAVIAVSALMLAPIVIVLTLGALYLRYGELPVVQSIVHGVAPAAAGLMLAAGLKLAVSELRRPWKFVIAGAALCGVGLLRWPLYVVLPISALVSVAFAWLLLAREADRDGAK
jgi:chromate transporter